MDQDNGRWKIILMGKLSTNNESVVSNMIKKTIKMRISVDPNNCAF